MLKPSASMKIPAETKQTAQAAFPNSSLYITLRDKLGNLFEDEEFMELYPSLGQPAESPTRLALITMMQFLENLTDRQAANAVRSRIDWKYLLGLELGDPGFHYSVLSKFRLRLIEGGAEKLLLDRLLARCEELDLLKGKKSQRTDSTHVLVAVRSLTLPELVGETMRRVLDEIARISPEWLQEHLQPEWIKRYGRSFDSYRLPKSKEDRRKLAITIDQDGFYLLKAIHGETGPAQLKISPKVEMLRRIWVQQYYWCDEKVHWRTKEEWGQPSAGQMISSPADPDIHYCVKRSTEWTGYKVPLTETCEPDQPRIITQVETTPSTVHDVKMTTQIQDKLISKGLQPGVQLVDEGCMEIDLLVSSRKKGIDLVGPIPSSKSWQDRDEVAFDHTCFQVDWEQRMAICPQGKTRVRCTDRKTWRGTPSLLFVFDRKDCMPCPVRKQCSRARQAGRTLTLYPQEQYEAQLDARKRQEMDEFKELYGKRAGIESAIAQGVKTTGLRNARYIGLARTHLQHIATAVAINWVRLYHWFIGERPEE